MYSNYEEGIFRVDKWGDNSFVNQVQKFKTVRGNKL